jgi:hypothetical protein
VIRRNDGCVFLPCQNRYFPFAIFCNFQVSFFGSIRQNARAMRGRLRQQARAHADLSGIREGLLPAVAGQSRAKAKDTR